MLASDILNQCSSKRDVHQLDAAADAEDRGISAQRGVEEIDLELIPIGVDTIRRRVDVVVSIPRWIHVRPSAEKEAVNDCHEFIDGIALRRKNDCNAICGFDRSHIRCRHAISEESAVGEGIQLR